jgi:hypothetical protein
MTDLALFTRCLLALHVLRTMLRVAGLKAGVEVAEELLRDIEAAIAGGKAG